MGPGLRHPIVDDARSQRNLLLALQRLPPPLQGPVLRAGTPPGAGPSIIREHPRRRPLGTHILAGELLRLLVLFAAMAAVVVASTLLGSHLLD
jgi:hypothetical protein